MNAPILVFDSGIGGLTVLRELRTAMPDRRFIYVADDAGFPYGDWEEEPLVARILDLFAELIDTYAPSLAVIACNTASTLVLPQLRARFAIPFVGTVPAIKPATERTRSGLVSVLATPGTVRRVYTRDLVEAFATHCEVRLVGSPELARLAERSLLDSEASGGQELDDAMAAEIAPCFVEAGGQRTDIVVLACTHYPLIANHFRRLAPWPVDWLDPAEAIARRARSLCKPGSGELPEGFDRAHFTGGTPGYQMRRLVRGFGLEVADSVG
ncbi:glutamate racemase [Aurantimonas coralicida]|uniref:glutamate racemase n=1 Tax=Aurantimonas coralicida TaxID=182270 RepID=UPI00238F3D35|nr:glutamate racemase [Aurantimonas coralicida]MDE0922939.1 glutamate racemase [Aurantimonas coralicida]